MIPDSELSLLVEQNISGVEILDLPCLASRNNLNLTSEDMADIRRQGISVYDNKEPALKKIPVPENILLTQLEEDNSWRYEGIICPRRSNNLQNTNAAFKKYSREEVTKMTKLDLFNFLSC